MNIKAYARDAFDLGLARAGIRQSQAKLIEAAQEYWVESANTTWERNSHVKGALDPAIWERIGSESRSTYRRLSAGLGDPLDENRNGPRTVVDWGCGGGANAVYFAGYSDIFVGVDPSQTLVEECGTQVRRVWGDALHEYRGQVIDLAKPWDVDITAGSVDLFLCLYVLELVPTPEYGVALMNLARKWLRPGGAAFVQFKYGTGSWRTRPRFRRYKANTLASMTTYMIHRFWEQMDEIGFEPDVMRLEPTNVVDERYSYILLRKPTE